MPGRAQAEGMDALCVLEAGGGLAVVVVERVAKRKGRPRTPGLVSFGDAGAVSRAASSPKRPCVCVCVACVCVCA